MRVLDKRELFVVDPNVGLVCPGGVVDNGTFESRLGDLYFYLVRLRCGSPVSDVSAWSVPPCRNGAFASLLAGVKRQMRGKGVVV